MGATELDFLPASNAFAASCRKSTKLHHTTAKQDTQLPSSWTPTSARSSGQSSQSLSSCCDARRHSTWSLEDGIGGELLARQRRPLGCALGSSISQKLAPSSILASSLSLSFCDDESCGFGSAGELWVAYGIRSSGVRGNDLVDRGKTEEES